MRELYNVLQIKLSLPDVTAAGNKIGREAESQSVEVGRAEF